MQLNTYNTLVIHYDEIGLKGRNRQAFEDLLIQNIRGKLNGLGQNLRRSRGYISGPLNGQTDLSEVEGTLRKIPGISYFYFSQELPLDQKGLEAAILPFAENYSFTSFKIETKRANKKFPLTSVQVNERLGAIIKENLKKQVNLGTPDICFRVEITQKSIYLSARDIAGVGGLPVDERQKVVALISGGFDSPVAAYLMMKRGCEVILVHCINENQEATAVSQKISRLAKQLSQFQNNTKLIIVPFGELQKKIIMNVRSDYRMLIYRRFMLQIANKIAHEHGASFLVVGDSLSQVASQTIDNLAATYKGIDTQILSPLIGLNKNEIIEVARKIGTFEISEKQHDDCCSFFISKHPKLRVKNEQLLVSEGKMENETVVQEAIASARLQQYP